MGTFRHTTAFILGTLERLTDDPDQFRGCNQDIQDDILLNLQEDNITGIYLTPLRFDHQIHYSQSHRRRTQ